MKKLSLYMMALMSAALVGCSDNYDPEVGPDWFETAKWPSLS